MVHLVGYFGGCITMHGFMNVTFGDDHFYMPFVLSGLLVYTNYTIIRSVFDLMTVSWGK